jgi:hypothetical protein
MAGGIETTIAGVATMIGIVRVQFRGARRQAIRIRIAILTQSATGTRIRTVTRMDAADMGIRTFRSRTATKTDTTRVAKTLETMTDTIRFATVATAPLIAATTDATALKRNTRWFIAKVSVWGTTKAIAIATSTLPITDAAAFACRGLSD